MNRSYAAMFGFGLFLLASWAGWGGAIARLLFRRIEGGPGLHAGWGLAFSLFVGGLLNLAGAISRATILIFVVAGVALLLLDWAIRRDALANSIRRRWQSRSRFWLGGVLVGAAVSVLYAASVCKTDFNRHDDFQGYFVFPAKMIQTGSLGPDPFSERRIVSLGSMSFLHAIVLSVADPRFYGVIDPGASLLLCVALLLEIARDARTSRWAVPVVLLLFLLMPDVRANMTSVTSGVALLLTLFLTLRPDPLEAGRRLPTALLAALVVSALGSLKTTFLPMAALLVALTYALESFRERSRRVSGLGALALAGVLTLLFMSPWMISLYQSNGTLLYPILGRGFHGSAYATFWSPSAGPAVGKAVGLMWMVFSNQKVLLLLIPGMCLFLHRDRVARLSAALAMFVSLVVFSALLILAVGGLSIWYRYAYPALIATSFALMMFVFPAGSAEIATRHRRRLLHVLGLAVVGLLVVNDGPLVGPHWSKTWAAIPAGVRKAGRPGLLRGRERRYVHMLDAVPEGAVVLARLEYPFLLDFTRHRVFIADYPGGSSPPPGMPFFQGGEPLAEYLCAQGVRYVAYSYRNEAGFSVGIYGWRLSPEYDAWGRSQAWHTFDFQANLAELGRTRTRIYDRGGDFVIDLAILSNGRNVPCAPTIP